MAIKFVKSLSGENCTTIETRRTKANTVVAADSALTISGGEVEPTAGKPVFISACATEGAASPTDTAVYPVLPQHVYETEFSVAAAAISEGDKVTLTSDGQKVTATTAGGVATVWRMFGTGVGDKVHIRFE